MADLTPLGFNPAEVADMGDGFKVIPPGTYNVVIVESDVQPTKAGGKMLVLKYQIIDGQQVGDTVVDRLNIVNSSETSQKIGLSQLKNICDAIGHVGQLKDSAQLHGKPMAVKIAIEKFKSNKPDASGEYKMLDSNRVEKRMPKQSASVSDPTPPAGEPAKKPAMAW